MFLKDKEIIGHSGSIYSSTSLNKQLYTGGADKVIAKWDLEKGVQESFSIKLSNTCYSLKIIKGNILSIGLSNGDLHLIDVELKKELKFYKQHKTSIFSIQTNSFKNHFYTADLEGNIAVWDTESLNLLTILPLNCGKIRRVNINNDGSFIVVSCQDGKIRVFDTQFYNEVYSSYRHKEGATSAIFNPKDNDILISGGKDALLKVVNWKEDRLIKEIPAHNFAIYDIISFENKNIFISGSRDKSIKTWSLNDYSFVSKIEKKEGGHTHSINDLEKIDQSTFASVGDDKRIIIWKIN